VASILSNPRYTGRQVWNRQRTDKSHQISIRVPRPLLKMLEKR